MIRIREFVGELVGTYLLVLFGCGSVAVSVLFDEYQSIMQIAIMWGIGVTLAIYATRHLSCAHLNPAVTIAMVVTGRMDFKRILSYLTGQFSGAFGAGLTIYGLFSTSIVNYERVNGIVRGSTESMYVARMFGEYYQLPGNPNTVSMPLAALAEGLGTFLLVFMIFSLTEGCNLGRPNNNLAPLFIGLSVSSCICLFAPLTQGGFNPARDFSPRMVALIVGWGAAAFPDNRGGFFIVYILAPVIGAILAGMIFTLIIERLLKMPKEDCCCHKNKPSN
jgi:glycerol uptake facilitator protein